MGIREFDWKLYQEAEDYLKAWVLDFLDNNKFAKELAEELETQTSTRLFDWIDYIRIPEICIDINKLADLQFLENKHIELPPNTRLFHNPGSIFFPILVNKEDHFELALKVEDIDDFNSVHANGSLIEGEQFSKLRKLKVSQEGDHCLTAVERRGYSGFVIRGSTDIAEYLAALELFSSREREFDENNEELKAFEVLARKILRELHIPRMADAFFRAERKYWESRNKAARVQKARQDELGMGWGNHDHHTFRSSRKNFIHLIRILELMGMVPRESFYAGAQAGWGAQVLEHPDCNIVVFADVDMGIDEKQTDFAHMGLVSRDKLGTVGLWVGLHGESIMQAGLHHLAVKVDFEKQENELLLGNGIKIMAPFSNFKFLKQDFTYGENWQVNESPARYLMDTGLITREQYHKFLNSGALGSHLENIERNQGFKGFNQESVSVIISETDPRKALTRRA